MTASDTAVVLTFRVGERRLAVDAADVAEVARLPRITRVPNAPAALAGVASLRGEVAPVVTLATLLGVANHRQAGGAEARGPSGSARVVVLHGSPPLGLAVDEVLGLKRAQGAGHGGLVSTEDGEARLLAIHTLLEVQFAGFSRPHRTVAVEPGRSAANAPEREVALLGFSLAGQPYALPLEQVREVAALPRDLASLPRTDAAMVGVTNHRGALLPVVSTRSLLGLPAKALEAGDRIVIAAVADSRVGLLVDDLASILRAPETAVGPVPAVLNRGAGEAQIDAMLRTSDGGLVSILAPERLFREESVAQILEDGRQKEVRMASVPQTGAQERLLVFTLAEESYGIPVSAVVEVIAQPKALTRLPRAPAFVAGVINLRGVVLPIVDQRRRFAVDGPAPAGSRVIITRVGEMVVGFAVDSVTAIVSVGESDISSTPRIAVDAGRVFDRVARVGADDRMILLVNPQELLDRAEADLLAALATEVTPPA
jgi:purine-binding chemotaxis protein CheW